MRYAIAALSVVGLLLAGCASIPTEGPVVGVSVSASPTAGSGADIAPEPPLKDASPAQIVGGFLVAMASGQAGISVASQYLTPTAAKDWNPGSAGVEIYAGDTPEQESQPGVLGFNIVGELDEVGRFSSLTGHKSYDFGLQQVDGQWRVSSPPTGLLVSEYMFGRYFQAFPVYFLSFGQKLIPELVYLAPGRTSYEQVLKSWSAGPSTWLAPAVVTDVPGEPLSVSEDDSGAVVVDFDPSISTLGEESRRRLGAELVWTLSSFPRITGVKITAGGRPFVVPGQGTDGTLDLASQQGWQVLSGSQTSDLFAIAAGRVGMTSDQGGFMSVSGSLGREKAGVAQLGISQGGAIGFAVLRNNDLWFGQLEGEGQKLNLGLTGLIDPQVSLDTGWVIGEAPDGGQRLVRVSPTGQVAACDLSAAPGKVVAFKVDPSGTRIALVATVDGRNQLGMLRLDEKTDSISAKDWRPITAHSDSVVLSDYQDVSWSGEDTLIVVAGAGTERHLAYTLRYDGTDVKELGPNGDYHLVGVSAQPRKSGLTALVETDSGQFLQFDAQARWRLIESDGVNEVLFAG